MFITNTPFLRNVLYADAATGLGAGALTIAGAGFLAPLLNLPASLIFWSGIALLPIVAFLLAMARRPEIPRGWLREIVFINSVWVVASLALLASGLVQPNLLGTLFVLAQAATVAVFAILQASALRSAGALAA